MSNLYIHKHARSHTHTHTHTHTQTQTHAYTHGHMRNSKFSDENIRSNKDSGQIEKNMIEKDKKIYFQWSFMFLARIISKVSSRF